MSNRADNYLSLCLEQAAKSPLHYRHGCIIVRGGKVIGQGYNDYRSGFSGGALKSGRLSNAGFDGQALCELKGKMKSKYKLKRDTDLNNTFVSSDDGSPTFNPFEASYSGNGGGHLVNTPLSMHSEMMAIHSALSASSTLASSAFASEKPCFKLQGHSKRKDRLRRDQLRTYVERVCKESAAAAMAKQRHRRGTEERRGESQVQEWYFEATASQPVEEGPGRQQQGGAGRGPGRQQGRGSVPMEKCGETPTEGERSWPSRESQRPLWTTDTKAVQVCV